MGEIAFTAGKNPSVKFTADSSRALRAGKRYGSGWRVIKTRSVTKPSTAPRLHQSRNATNGKIVISSWRAARVGASPPTAINAVARLFGNVANNLICSLWISGAKGWLENEKIGWRKNDNIE